MLPISKLFDLKDGSLASDKSIQGNYDFITGSEEWKNTMNINTIKRQ